MLLMEVSRRSLLGKERWRNKEQGLMDKTRNEEDLSKKLDALPSSLFCSFWSSCFDMTSQGRPSEISGHIDFADNPYSHT